MTPALDDSIITNAPEPSADYARLLAKGYTFILGSFLLLTTWAAFAKIDSAVVAPGSVAVESNRKTVQHLEGGIVSEILVRDGDSVKKGDVILRLDQTRSAASEELYRKQQAIALALEARLQAQINLKESLVYPEAVRLLANDPMVQASLQDNARQFDGRRSTFKSAYAVLESQIEQARRDLSQARSDKITAEKQLESVQKELRPLEDLLARGLVPLPRVTTLQRQEQQLQGISSKADIDLSRSLERVNEIETRQRQLKDEYSQEAATAMPDVRKMLSDLQQQLVLARDTLKRVDIIAPVGGTIHQLRIFTVGGVVRPGDAIVDVVPDTARLVVRAKVAPVDIDRIHPSLPVEIRLPQFQYYGSEIMRGTLRSISQDTVADEATRTTYYAVEVEVDRASIPQEISTKLVAGMTVDVVVPTAERTILQFVLSPLINRLRVAMRER